MSTENTDSPYKSSSLAWLADAPLFIDERQVGSFYDAVVRPESITGKIVLGGQGSNGFKVSGKVGASAEVGTGELFKLFPFLSGKATVNADASGEYTGSSETTQSVEVYPIMTPQRQLVQLGLHYSANLPDRLLFIRKEELSDEEWRSDKVIQCLPRALCFIELPGLDDLSQGNLTQTKLIPISAEFTDGTVVLLYDQFRAVKDNTMPPPYPTHYDRQPGTDPSVARQKYC